MKVIYQLPNPNSIYAYRTIYNGYKNAFTDLGHKFYTLTQDDNIEKFLDKHQPDLFMTSTHFFYRKYLDFNALKKHRNRGMNMLTKIDFWNSPFGHTRINEAQSMKQDKEALRLILDGDYGHEFYHTVERDDMRMDGFEKTTGFKYHTIPLAADKVTLRVDIDPKFKADISYLGTNLPQKREFFAKYVYPLGNKYDLKLYGQDWTAYDRALGWMQKFGAYFNLPIIKSIQKPKLKLEEEAKIYSSSKVSINVHEDYQKKFGGECNERTFKIPFCGGFEVVDNVACISKYFIPGKEIIIGESNTDWYEKVEYYLKNPEKRIPIIEAGRKLVAEKHTYHNRVNQIVKIFAHGRKK